MNPEDSMRFRQESQRIFPMIEICYKSYWPMSPGKDCDDCGHHPLVHNSEKGCGMCRIEKLIEYMEQFGIYLKSF